MTNIKDFLKQYKVNDKPRVAAQVIIFDLIFITIAALSILSVDIFFIGLCFVILPAFFSTQVCIDTICAKHQVTNKEFGKGFTSYFEIKKPFFGCFDVIKGLLFSLLVYLGTSFVVSIIFTYFPNSQLAILTEELIEIIETSGYEQFLARIETSEELTSFYALNSVICLGTAGIFFGFRVLKFCLNIEYRPITGIAGPKNSNRLFRRTFAANRKEILRDIYSQFWYVMLLMIAADAGASMGLYFLGFETIAPIVGFTAFVLVGSIFLPKYLMFILALRDKYESQFKKSLGFEIDNLLKVLNANNQINEEQKKRVQEFLNKMKDDSPDIDDLDDDDPFENK